MKQKDQVVGQCIMIWNWKRVPCGFIFKSESGIKKLYDEATGLLEDNEIDHGTRNELVIYPDRLHPWMTDLHLEKERKLTIRPVGENISPIEKIVFPRAKPLGIITGSSKPVLTFGVYPRMTPGGRTRESFKIIEKVV